MKTIKQQIQDNSVALISLFIAVSSLAYNTWRNETTEQQRNIRFAAFRVLEELGELQQVVDLQAYVYKHDTDAARQDEARIRGYGNVLLTRDLMNVMPKPGPAAGENLFDLWQQEINPLAGSDRAAAKQAEGKLSAAISETRQAVVMVLSELD